MNKEIPISNIRLALKLNNVVLPFNVTMLTNLLAQMGYSPVPRTPEMEIFSVTGTSIVKKDKIFVEINEQKQVIAVSCTDVETSVMEIVDAFKVIMDVIEASLGSQRLRKYFFETGIFSLVESQNNPLKVFSNNSNRINRSSEFNDIFGQEVSPYAFAFFPTGAIIDDTDWFEYSIQPFPIRPEKVYQISFLYRNKEFRKVEAAVQNFSSISSRLITSLETESV